VKNNPSPEIVKDAKQAFERADKAIQRANDAINDAASRGAKQPGDQPTGDPEGFESDEQDNNFKSQGSKTTQTDATTPDQTPVDDQKAASDI